MTNPALEGASCDEPTSDFTSLAKVIWPGVPIFAEMPKTAKATPSTPAAYIASLPAEQAEVVQRIRKILRERLPNGFKEVISYGMIAYVVPHKLFPAGYHCNPDQPLPFISIAGQKGGITFHHMGIYAHPQLLKWFRDEHMKLGVGKLDMGKSCIRFSKPEAVPYDLLGKLAEKITPQQWVDAYTAAINSRKKLKR